HSPPISPLFPYTTLFRSLPSPLRSRPFAMQKPAITLMVKAARAAGNVLLRHMYKLDALNVVEKDRMDFASEVDELAEKEIIKELDRKSTRLNSSHVKISY